MSSALVWFRRDLRHFDHAALYAALQKYQAVFCAFVFDRAILDTLTSTADRRVEFIWHAVQALDKALDELSRASGGQGAGLLFLHGDVTQEIPALAQRLGVSAVLANRDYEPQAIQRDQMVADALSQHNILFQDFKDQVVFEKDDVLTQQHKPFAVFTPYRKAWLKRWMAHEIPFYDIPAVARQLAARQEGYALPSLAALGFEQTNLTQFALPLASEGGVALIKDFFSRIDRYHELRDYPAKKGVSYLSMHLRFGTVSARMLAQRAWNRGGAGAETWLSELIWREFYQMILFHHPRVVREDFQVRAAALQWAQRPAWLQAWQQGNTGYPLVDAGMRQLNQTGFMHNRLRMIVASFLTKDLGIDWREGEKYFAQHLNDYDLAANNGGWQWAASTGCDAQPWFRIFNPVTQSQRFDAGGQFIRRYVPELAAVDKSKIHAPWTMTLAQQQHCGVIIGQHYPLPIIDHAQARLETLARFKE